MHASRDVTGIAEFPSSSGAPSAHASLGLHLATRTPPAPSGRAFASLERVLESHARGALALDDTIRIAGWTTTVGRHLVAACLPSMFREVVDEPWQAVSAARLLARITRELHVEIAARAVTALEAFGRYVADRSGFSLTLDDFAAPVEAGALIASSAAETIEANRDYDEGRCTDGERYNRIGETWSRAAAAVRSAARDHARAADPLAACAASVCATPPPEALRTMRGVRETCTGMAPAQVGTLATGFACHEYFLACIEARAHRVDADRRADEATALWRDLMAAIGDVRIVAVDCGTTRGVRIPALADSERAGGSLARAIEGRVTAADVVTRAGELLAAANTLIAPDAARRIEAERLPSLTVRDVRTCGAPGGVCARCFGLAPEDATWPSIGDDIGARAAAAIAVTAARELPREAWFTIC